MHEEQSSGRAVFGLDMERMVLEAWNIFVNRPLTFLGIALLVVLTGFLAHVLIVGVFFWLPFTLCIPYAVVQIRCEEKSDRIFLGWISYYPRLLAVFVPSLVLPILLVFLFGQVGHELVVEGRIRSLYFEPLASFVELVGIYVMGLAGLLAVRRNLSASQSLMFLFSDGKGILEVLLLGATLALFAISGIVVCCLGLIATTAFSWVCLGVAYYQIFEQ